MSILKIWLWTLLGCNFDVRANMRSSHRDEGVLVDINGEGKVSGPRVGSRVRSRGSIRSTCEIGLQLDSDPSLL